MREARSGTDSWCSASPVAQGRGVATLCLQSAVRSGARWRRAGPNHCPSGEGGDWAAASICVVPKKTGWEKNAGPGHVEVVSKVKEVGERERERKKDRKKKPRSMKPKVKKEPSAV